MMCGENNEYDMIIIDHADKSVAFVLFKASCGQCLWIYVIHND